MNLNPKPNKVQGSRQPNPSGDLKDGQRFVPLWERA